MNVNTGLSTTATFSDLKEAQVYYFAATMYDTDGNESVFSNEVSYDLAAVDTDEDGLSDWEEISLYKTNPDVADSDGDGLSDGDEVKLYTTDPLQADTDGDGVADGEEVKQGSDPVDPTSTPTPSSTIFAVNAGGGQYITAGDTVYQADTGFTGGSTYGTTATIAGTGDPTLYQSERYGNFSYDVPMPNGDYVVTLRFAEIYHSSIGKRVFDVAIEGVVVIDDLDLVARVGKNVAYDVVVPVRVMDGVLNINFRSVVNNAKVSAIEVTAAIKSPENLTMVPGPIAMQVTLQWDPSADSQFAGYNVYYGYASRQYSVNVDVGTATTASFSNLADAQIYYFAVTAYDAAGKESSFSKEISYDLATVDTDQDGLSDWEEISLYKTDPNLADTDGDGLSDDDEVKVYQTDPTNADSDGDGITDGVEVSKESNPLDPGSTPGTDGELLAVNAGGGLYAGVDGTDYEGDFGFDGGRTSSTTAAIAGTEDDALYQTERYGNFSYNMPLASGDYEVTLKFAEIYFSGVGERVFNVSFEGKAVISDLDLVAEVGPRMAYDVALPITVTDGVLNIGFHSVVNNAKVSAIKVVPKEVIFAVNSGGPEYIDATELAYDADAGFSGGKTNTTTAGIAGTEDDTLYQSERYGNFSYNIPVENGEYEVTLKFAEIYFTSTGKRVFNVLIEGKTVISKLDLVAKVGPKVTYDVVVPAAVSDGVLNITFQSVVNNAKVSAIKVTAK